MTRKTVQTKFVSGTIASDDLRMDESGVDLELMGVNCGCHGTEKGVSIIGKSFDLLENPGLVFASVLHLYDGDSSHSALHQEYRRRVCAPEHRRC